MQNTGLFRVTCYGFSLAGFVLGSMAYGQDLDCSPLNDTADSSYDFTEDLSRWGSSDTFDIDTGDYQVGSITISQLPIFDESNPREDNGLFRWANRVHFDTRQDVIQDQLLFSVYDSVDSETLAETERILRERKYVSDANVRVLRQCGDTLDLEVVTKEVWTLTPDFSFKSGGGDSSHRVGIRDTNFLGTGQQFSFSYKNEPERNSYEVFYHNPNINGSRREFQMTARNSSDGHQYTFQYQQPFYALDSHRSWNISYDDTREILSQYHLGLLSSQVRHLNPTGEISLGFSDGLVDDTVKRFAYGVHYEKQQYSRVDGLLAPTDFPDDVSLLYPFAEYEFIENQYVVAYNISQIYRTEDLHVGKYFRTRIGYDTGQQQRIVFDGSYADTLLYRPKMLLQFNADWSGRWNREKGDWEDTEASMQLHYNRGQTDKRTLFIGLEASYSRGLNSSRRISLGGNNGLRGFDSHYLNGTGSVLLTVEQRYFSDYHFLQLARVGYAAFIDAGQIYGAPDDTTDGVFTNVGFGLRLAPSKSDKGGVMHFDLSYPLSGYLPQGRAWQFTAEMKTSF